MVQHFEEMIADNIEGKAKAMVVTKSRLHAVLYKLAFDKYLKEKVIHIRHLWHFLGQLKTMELNILNLK